MKYNFQTYFLTVFIKNTEKQYKNYNLILSELWNKKDNIPQVYLNHKLIKSSFFLIIIISSGNFILDSILYVRKKQKLYEHQIFSFIILFTISFGIKFTASFSKQCIFPTQDLNNIDNILETQENNNIIEQEILKNIL